MGISPVYQHTIVYNVGHQGNGSKSKMAHHEIIYEILLSKIKEMINLLNKDTHWEARPPNWWASYFSGFLHVSIWASKQKRIFSLDPES